MEHKKTTHAGFREFGIYFAQGSVWFLRKETCKHLSTQKLQCSWEAVQVLSLNSALDVHLHRICIHRFRLRHLTGEWNHLRNGRLPLINSNLQSSVELILQNGLINSTELSESYIIRIEQYHSSSYQSEHIFSCTTFPCRLKTLKCLQVRCQYPYDSSNRGTIQCSDALQGACLGGAKGDLVAGAQTAGGDPGYEGRLLLQGLWQSWCHVLSCCNVALNI